MSRNEIQRRKDNAAREAIKALERTVTDNELLGSGSLPPVSVRVAAAISLGKYLSYPEAVRALTKVMRQSWAPDEVREAAARALGNR